MVLSAPSASEAVEWKSVIISVANGTYERDIRLRKFAQLLGVPQISVVMDEPNCTEHLKGSNYGIDR